LHVRSPATTGPATASRVAAHDRFSKALRRTKDFLSNLRDEEVETLGDGIRLVNAIRTVGTSMKWVIVGFLGFVVGLVMLGESVLKIVGWFRPPP
jgi:hypothetical protein